MRASALPTIQSIVAGYPLPSVFLYRRHKNGRLVYDVIDGKQRIESILMFMGVMRGRYATKSQLPGKEEVEVIEGRRTAPKDDDCVCLNKLIYIRSLEAKSAPRILVLDLNWQEPRAITAGNEEIESIVNEWKVDMEMLPDEKCCNVQLLCLTDEKCLAHIPMKLIIQQLRRQTSPIPHRHGRLG